MCLLCYGFACVRACDEVRPAHMDRQWSCYVLVSVIPAISGQLISFVSSAACGRTAPLDRGLDSR